MGKLALALAAVALAAALTACGSEAAPAPATPTPTPAATASPGPSVATTATARPTRPVMPEAARAHTKAGATAFTLYVVDLVNYSFRSLDPGPLEALATDYCTTCRGGTAGVRKIAARRGHVDGGLWTVKSHQVARLPVPGNPIAVAFTFDAAPEIITYPNGRQDSYAGGPARDRLVLTPATTGWRIADWTVLR